jgi:hypothetical protein
MKERLQFLQYVKSQIQSQQSGSIDFSRCVRMAFDGMTNYFRDGILNVIHMADTAEKNDSKPFWTGAKRKPRALEWGAHVSDPQQRTIAMEFLYAASNMNAFVWGVDPIRNRKSFEEFVLTLNLEQGPWTLSTDSVILEVCIIFVDLSRRCIQFLLSNESLTLFCCSQGLKRLPIHPLNPAFNLKLIQFPRFCFNAIFVCF